MKDSNKILMRAAVTYPKGSKQPVLFITLPLGVTLAPGLALQVDEGEAMRIPYERCLGIGCRASTLLGDKMIAVMKKGKQAKVVFADPQGKQVAVPVSLSGFTAAFNSLN